MRPLSPPAGPPPARRDEGAGGEGVSLEGSPSSEPVAMATGTGPQSRGGIRGPLAEAPGSLVLVALWDWLGGNTSHTQLGP